MEVGDDSDCCSKTTVPLTSESPRSTATEAMIGEEASARCSSLNVSAWRVG